MGRLINGANGPFIGKVGAIIGYTVNGVGYIKGLYKKRTKAPTEKEALNRKKFAAAQKWLQPIQAYARAGFKGYNERFQGFVAAKSFLLKNALNVIDGEIVIDPALVKISFGNLPLPENIECVFQDPYTFRFSWATELSEGKVHDQVMVLAHHVEGCDECGIVYGSYRNTGEQLVPVGDPTGKTFHIYLAFIAADRSRQSDSVYLGKFEF